MTDVNSSISDFFQKFQIACCDNRVINQLPEIVNLHLTTLQSDPKNQANRNDLGSNGCDYL